jgi:hypothetical protein
MEIILALMALAATPFGAALLGKPTRKRFVKYAKAHDPRKAHQTMAEVLALEPRDKDWSKDKALMDMWDEAFFLFGLHNWKTQVDEVVVQFRTESLKVEAARQEWEQAKSAYHNHRGFSETLWEARELAEQNYNYVKDSCSRRFSPIDLKIIRISQKYNVNSFTELRYKQDLIRHADAENFNYSVDMLALTQ